MDIWNIVAWNTSILKNSWEFFCDFTMISCICIAVQEKYTVKLHILGRNIHKQVYLKLKWELETFNLKKNKFFIEKKNTC